MSTIKISGDGDHCSSWFREIGLVSIKKAEIMTANITYHSVQIPAKEAILPGYLAIPVGCTSLVIFAHGCGSSSLSRRNKVVSTYLNEHGIGTLLFDLLSIKEEGGFSNRYNINLLSHRLIEATKWALKQKELGSMRMGYFGSSTGAAAALVAAERLPGISTVVSRGGRPDLASEVLPKINIPVLLIVGSLDSDVLKLNRHAYESLHCEKRLEIVKGAAHLFEEKGMIEKVAAISGAWFETHLHLLELSD